MYDTIDPSSGVWTEKRKEDPAAISILRSSSLQVLVAAGRAVALYCNKVRVLVRFNASTGGATAQTGESSLEFGVSARELG